MGVDKKVKIFEEKLGTPDLKLQLSILFVYFRVALFRSESIIN